MKQFFTNRSKIKIPLLFFALLCAFVLSSTSLLAQYPTNGLVAYYPFDGSTNDYSGNGYNLTAMNGAVTYTADQNGMVSGAVNLGAGKYLQNTNSAIMPTGSFTISYWTYNGIAPAPAQYGTVVELNENIYCRHVQGAAFYQHIGQYNNASNNYDYQYLLSNSYQAWIQYSVVFDDAANTVTFYQGGVQVATQACNFNPIALFNTGIIVGAGTNSGVVSTTKYLNGNVDDLFIYNRALSVSELGTLINPATCNPVFTQQPAGATYCNGQTVTLNATVTNLTGITYQWQKNGVNISNGVNVSGATTAALTLTNFAVADAGAYTLVATNVCGTTVSNTATLLAASINGLQAWYKLDNNAADSSGLGNNGTNNGATAATNRFGYANRAYSLNGTSQYVALAAGIANTNFANKTISMWFKRRTLTNNANGEILLYLNDGGGNQIPAVYIGNDGILRGHIYQGGSTPWSSGTNISDTAWHHLLITTTTNTQSCYLDGVFKVTLNGTLNTGTTTLFSVGFGYMGYNLIGLNSGNRYFNGYVDDIRVYIVNFNQAQVTQVKNMDLGFITQPQSYSGCTGSPATFTVNASGNVTYQWKKNGVNIGGQTTSSFTIANVQFSDTGSYTCAITDICTGETATSNVATISFSGSQQITIPNLTAWYKFDNNSADSSGNANDATATISVTPTTNRFNQSNSAYAFNGTSSYVTFPQTIIGNAQNKSISLWFKRASLVNTPGMLLSYDNGVPGAWNPAAYVGNDGKLHGYFYGGASSVPWATTGTIDTNWHQLILVNAVTLQTVYLDNVQIGTVTGTINTTGASVLRVGAGYANTGVPGISAAGYQYFNGKIDEVRFYNSVITASNINQLYTTEIGFAAQPQNQVACVGNSATFTVRTLGNVSYQWKRNAVNIAGATSASYTINNVQAVDTGSFSCVIVNNCSGAIVASNAAVLSLGNGASISTQPQNQVPCLGASASFSVAVTGGSATYQWKRNGLNISGATSATYNIAATVQTDTGTYICEVTSLCGPQNSTSATLTISSATSITTQLQPVVVCVGNAANFSVVAGGTGPFSYVWKKGTIVLIDGSNISGATTANLQISNTGANDPGNYTVTITGACGTAISNSVSLSFGLLATITTQPATLVQTCEGSSTASFTVVANANGLPLTYQWKHYTNPVQGATSPTITFPLVSLADSGKYTCVITTNCGSVTTTVANLRVNPKTIIMQEPTAVQNICTGSALSFSVVAAGQTLTYQWKKNGTAISGATNASYNIASAVAGDAGSYVCYVAGGCGSDTSIASVVTVTPGPAIALQPQSQTLCVGNALNLSVSVTGSGLTYQWQKGGNNLSGQTSSTFSIANVTVGDSGSYACIINSGCGSLNSQTATIVVNPLPSASISPSSATICAGTPTTLTASGGGTYAWSNGLGSNVSQIVSPTTTSAYSVTVTKNNCSASLSSSITVNPIPNASITGASSVCDGQPISLTANGGGTYLWSSGGGTNVTASFSPITATTYTVTVTGTGNCTSTASKTVTVTTVTAAINGATTICSGLQATLTASGGGTYQWSNSLGTNAAVTVSPSTATTYTVTVTNNSCTAIASQTVTVTSSPTATITGASAVCAGSNITLTANGGNTYAWSNGGGTSANASFAPTATTTYTVTVSLGAGCTASASKTITIKQPTTGSFSQTICFGQSVLFNGINRTQTGSFLDTLINTAGCDSFLTFNLTVRPQITGSISRTVCFGDSTLFNGVYLKQSGVFKDTLVSVTTCDSILTLNFTVRPKITTTLNQALCNGSVITFNGQAITQGGTYFDTLTSISGCDSFIALNVTIAQATAATIAQTACGIFFFNGQTITQSGTYKDTLINAAGCDSIITLNLIIDQPTSSSKADTICNGSSYTFGGQSFNQTGIYTDTISNTAGCDSVITLNLFVRPALAITITQTGFDLSATGGFASYQWQLNTVNINNATAQNYTATQNASYNVMVTDVNGCTATSTTTNVTGVGIEDLIVANVHIYPNPTADKVTIETTSDLQDAQINILSVDGKLISIQQPMSGLLKTIDVASLSEGVYIIELKSKYSVSKTRFVKAK